LPNTDTQNNNMNALSESEFQSPTHMDFLLIAVDDQ